MDQTMSICNVKQISASEAIKQAWEIIYGYSFYDHFWGNICGDF